MRRLILILAAAVVVGAIVIGAVVVVKRAKPTAPVFLQQTMDRYHDLKSLQADCVWTMKQGQPTVAEQRTLAYASPNRFKVVSRNETGFEMTSVSDGKKEIDYSSVSTMSVMRSDAPASIATAGSMLLQHPMFCGSLLYKLFAGSKGLDKLADLTKGAPAYGSEVTVDGQPCITVRFYAVGMYGHTEFAVGSRDGLVRRITYDSEPLAKIIAQKYPAIGSSYTTAENYSHIVTDRAVSAAAFNTTPPAGSHVAEEPQMPDSSKPPIPSGQPAPDFTLSALGSQPVTLSSLRGKVVVLDFWATWCPPCRESLPETQRLSRLPQDKGLTVLTVDDEDAKTISGFLSQNNYSFTVLLDGKDDVARRYNVEALPSTVIIDRQGRVADFLVGYHPPEDLAAALRKAGFQSE
jgi:peroxiredoxin/outer membrane lipoprotein-sorting protein